MIRPNPKPPARAPQQLKPIARKRAKKRTWKSPRCQVLRCNKKAEVLTYCNSHAKSEADRRFSLYIRARDGKCMIPNASPCIGPLQCCHILSRRFLATRWDEQNAVAGCAGHHAYWTRNPDRWAAFVEDRPSLKSLRRAAFDGETANLAEVLGRYPK